MVDPVSYASFMVRVWRDPAAEPDAVKAVSVCEVEFVQSGRKVAFRGLEALVDLLVGPLTEPADLLEGDVGSEGPAPLSGKG